MMQGKIIYSKGLHDGAYHSGWSVVVTDFLKIRLKRSGVPITLAVITPTGITVSSQNSWVGWVRYPKHAAATNLNRV